MIDITRLTVKERYLEDNKAVGDIWSPIWDVNAAADSLDTEVSLYNDVVAGAGYKLRLKPQSELQLFPENHIMLLRNPYFVLNMAHVTSVEPLKGKLVIESGDATNQAQLVLRANGELIFNVYDRKVLQAMPDTEANETPPAPRRNGRKGTSGT